MFPKKQKPGLDNQIGFNERPHGQALGMQPQFGSLDNGDTKALSDQSERFRNALCLPHRARGVPSPTEQAGKMTRERRVRRSEGPDHGIVGEIRGANLASLGQPVGCWKRNEQLLPKDAYFGKLVLDWQNANGGVACAVEQARRELLTRYAVEPDPGSRTSAFDQAFDLRDQVHIHDR